MVATALSVPQALRTIGRGAAGFFAVLFAFVVFFVVFFLVVF